MTTQEFMKLHEERFEKSLSVLAAKANEYARGDRLSNFKKAAGAMGCTPERALIGMLMKHIISICDLVGDLEAETTSPKGCWTLEMWDEKIGDAVNYLILLEGLVTERLVKPESDRTDVPQQEIEGLDAEKMAKAMNPRKFVYAH